MAGESINQRILRVLEVIVEENQELRAKIEKNDQERFGGLEKLIGRLEDVLQSGKFIREVECYDHNYNKIGVSV